MWRKIADGNGEATTPRSQLERDEGYASIQDFRRKQSRVDSKKQALDERPLSALITIN